MYILRRHSVGTPYLQYTLKSQERTYSTYDRHGTHTQPGLLRSSLGIPWLHTLSTEYICHLSCHSGRDLGMASARRQWSPTRPSRRASRLGIDQYRWINTSLARDLPPLSVVLVLRDLRDRSVW